MEILRCRLSRRFDFLEVFFTVKYLCLAITYSAFLSLLLSSFECFASQKTLYQASIEIIDVDVENATEELDKIINNAGGEILNKGMIRNDSIFSRTYRVRFKSTQIDAALSRMRKIGTVDRERASYNTDNEAVVVQIELSNKREKSAPKKMAQLLAGASGAALSLNLSNDFKRSMIGAGISLTPAAKWAYLTILVLKDNEKQSASNQEGTERQSASGSSMLLIGHNYYSAIFGNGANTFINPFAGVNYGIARLYNKTMMAFGGTLGVELLNTQWLTISAAAKVNGLYSSRDGGTSTMYEAQVALPF